MKRLLVVALITHMLSLSQLRDVGAAESYDGEWNGSATSSTGGRCRPANVTLTVKGRVVTGQAKFEVDTANIHGTVSQDGAFGATIGFQPLTGEFVQDQFKGAFKNGNCVWNLLLRRPQKEMNVEPAVRVPIGPRNDYAGQQGMFQILGV